MSTYRIAYVEWSTPFGERRITPSVQLRVGYFWWVTLTHCETVTQAKTYICNVKNRPKEKLIRLAK